MEIADMKQHILYFVCTDGTGFDQWVQRYNPATKRMQSYLETQWQWVQLERVNWEQRYLASDLGMQVNLFLIHHCPNDPSPLTSTESIAFRVCGW